MYKLIAIDLDGTLLNDKKEISKKDYESILRAYHKGLIIIIVTGRSYYSAKKIVKDFGFDINIISNNGAILRYSKNDNDTILKHIKQDDLDYLLKLSYDMGLEPTIHVNYYRKGIDLITSFDNPNKEYIMSYENRYIFINKEYMNKIKKALSLVYIDDKIKINHFYGQLIRTYGDRFSYHILENLRVCGAMLEVQEKRSTKYQTLIEYAHMVGIRPEEIIAIGDDNNDIEMIQNVGLGVSMRNGTQLCKMNASIVTNFDNNNSGVSEVLDFYLK
ncbi:Cof-type HAD-IIB family hydrolase [Soehngenia saccharolytica]|nr:Cof-type HAD-IIB family hydrolase [Soehngenia saccharolytica]